MAVCEWAYSLAFNWAIDLLLVIRLKARLQPNFGNTLRPVLTVFTRSGITPPKVNRFGWNLMEYSIGAVARPGEFSKILSLSGKQRTILLISRRLQFTKFEHNTSIGVAMNRIETEFWKFPLRGRFFSKNAKIDFFSTSCDFRPPWLRNDYRSTEIHYQMFLPRDV